MSDAPLYDLRLGNALSVLKSLEAESVNCVVCSPPYWGLRAYGGIAPDIWDGEEGSEHAWGAGQTATVSGGLTTYGGKSSSRGKLFQRGDVEQGAFCSLCGA